MITEQERRRRRFTLRFVQLGLIALSLGIILAFVAAKRSESRGPDVTLQTDGPSVALLGPGDARLFNVDTTVELVLRGDKLLAGLSPKVVERVRAEIRDAGPSDPSGIGGAIAKAVKEQVADKIDMHVAYDVRDVQDMRFEDGRVIIEWMSGKNQELFGSIQRSRDGRREDANRFHREEALRFIELVKARQRQLNR